jgi:cell division protein FtsB
VERSKNIKAIDEQIKRKQDKIFRLKDESDRLTAEISDLLKKRKMLQTDEIVKEIGRSKKSYENDPNVG